jgi:phage gpG-like protein
MAKITIKVKKDDKGSLEIAKTFMRFKGGKVGVLGGDSYPNGLTAAANAAIHNFGTKTIPARPFMDEGAKLFAASKAQVAKLYTAAIESHDESVANQRVGALFAQKIRDAIRGGSYAALAKSTIARKGSSKPLIDTGLLIGSITYEEN